MHQKSTNATPAREAGSPAAKASSLSPKSAKSTRRFGNVRRLGAPRHWSADLYIRLIDGRWWLVIGALCVGWFITNVCFALLYIAGGDCIAGARAGSLLDAFNFSVQTLSTMGFGGMVPKTDWANAVVGLEALVGLLETAMATGLIFAKFSRPRANALFSNVAVLNTWEGQPALMFRVANRRGNDVVEASMRVSVLKRELTSEGHEMRRLHELPLLRSRSPVFSLSWTAIHIVDESSPLFEVEPTRFEDDEMMLVISLTGFDGTYNQTIHGRHVYHSEDMRWGHRFVDVITQAKDGALVLDFSRFHDTIEAPLEEGS